MQTDPFGRNPGAPAFFAFFKTVGEHSNIAAAADKDAAINITDASDFFLFDGLPCVFWFLAFFT